MNVIDMKYKNQITLMYGITTLSIMISIKLINVNIFSTWFGMITLTISAILFGMTIEKENVFKIDPCMDCITKIECDLYYDNLKPIYDKSQKQFERKFPNCEMTKKINELCD